MPDPRSRTWQQFAWLCLEALIRFSVGVVLTQFQPGAILLTSWGQETARRGILRLWAKRAGVEPEPEWTEWPRWVRGNPAETRRLKRFLKGFWDNLKSGLAVAFNTWLLTLPATALWAFGWRYGWDNSFNKGYEMAYIGPTLSVLGIVCFMVVLPYLPAAQSHQALTGTFRSFWDFRTVYAALRHNALGFLWVIVLWLAALLFIRFGMTAVILSGNSIPAEWTDAEVLRALKNRYIALGVVGFPLYALVRVAAARAYARGAWRARAEGCLASMQFGRHAADAAMLLPQTAPSAPWRRWAGKPAFALAAIVLVLLGFGFVAQLYVQQFFAYIPLEGWLHLPIIHTPWFRSIPSHL